MFSCFKKSEKFFTTRGLFTSAMSHVKLIARFYIRHKNMISMVFFTAVSKVFAEKYNKKYSTGNEELIEFETATITRDYVLHNHFSIS